MCTSTRFKNIFFHFPLEFKENGYTSFFFPTLRRKTTFPLSWSTIYMYIRSYFLSIQVASLVEKTADSLTIQKQIIKFSSANFQKNVTSKHYLIENSKTGG